MATETELYNETVTEAHDDESVVNERSSTKFISWSNLRAGQSQSFNRGFRGAKTLRFQGRPGSSGSTEVQIRAVERRSGKPDKVIKDATSSFSGSFSTSFNIVPTEPTGGYSVSIRVRNTSSSSQISGDGFHS